MNEDERRLDGLSSDEHALENRLSRLGDLLQELRQAETEADSAFTRTLRAHLLHGEDLAPHPTFARRLRASLLRPRGARPVSRPRRRFTTWLPVLAAIVALAGFVLTHLPGSAVFPTPAPTRADLIANLPGVTRITDVGPTASAVRRSTATLFHGPLHLLAPPLSNTPTRATAYRLRARPPSAVRARHLLDIRGRIHPVQGAGVHWLVAADGGKNHHSLHSVAVSLATGELVYHDRRNYVLPRSARPLGVTTAVAVARHWLQRLGWPGETMPVRNVGLVQGRPRVRRVVLGWPRAGLATIGAATLWVTPDHSVIEADVWPSVEASGKVPLRSARAAWSDTYRHRAPLAILGTQAGRGRLRGRLHGVSKVLILVPGPRRSLYLLPAYRFQGTGRIGSSGWVRHWISLARGR